MTDAYLRFPHVRHDLITFVAEDDVWLAPVTGGRAWRVSADQVPVANPRLSGDGTAIAWRSNRDVEPEVHLAPVDGGRSERLTHWGDLRTTVRGWTPDGHVLATSATGQASRSRSWAYAVPTDGSPATRLPFGHVTDVDIAVGADGSAGGVVVSSVYLREPAHWKRYRGGTAGKVWVDAGGTGEFTRILSEVDGNIQSPMWVGGRIAFLSDHGGIGNLYSCLPDGSDLRPHSEHTDFYARNATSDGTRVVYHRAGRVWLHDDLDAEPREVDIRLGGPRVSRQTKHVSAGPNLRDVGPDKTGRASAVEVRGTIHWLTHRDGPVRALAVQDGVRGRLPRVLGDTGQVVWVTDVDGEDALEFAPATGVEPGTAPRRVGTGELGRVLELAASPDGKRVGLTTHDGRLLLVDADDGDVREVARATEMDPTGLVFSPDSAWLAWSHPGPDPLRHIRMVNTADLSVVDVTPLRFVDWEPAFTADGKHVAFLSSRSFDPIYDVHVFDLSFANGTRPHLVPLAATTPSPFAPLREGRPFGEDKDDDKDSGSDGESGESKDDKTPRTVVDVEGIEDRVVAFPVPAARFSELRAAKGGVLWRRDPLTGALGDDLDVLGEAEPRSVLERFDLAKLKVDTLVDGFDAVWVSGDGQRLVVKDGNALRVVPADRKADSDDRSEDNITVDLSRVRVRVDPEAEWGQMFDENGRLMRDHFWRADLGGKDWAAVLDRYRPIVDSLGSHDDLVDLLWEVQGELDTSHAYVMPAGSGGDGRRRLGLLGADFARDDDGAWRITRIVPGESSDPRARSPLRAPGVAVREGDAITAVDGRPVDPLRGPAPLLVGTAGKPVELAVVPKAGGAARRVVVEPLLDDEPLRYQAWVTDRRAHVHAASDGRLGYLHVPDMVASGWAQFHRDLRMEMRREGIVVDLRENRGGHLSQLIIEKLSRRIVGWGRARDGYYLETYPADAPRGPVVAVADEFSGSDGDIVNAAIKALGIGPIVGTRTWGGVVGIDMKYRLVDGTLVTQPRYATWMQGYEWGVENHGVDPDVEVPVTPQDHAAGRDPQLDTAVRIALDALAECPALTPPDLPPLR